MRRYCRKFLFAEIVSCLLLMAVAASAPGTLADRPARREILSSSQVEHLDRAPPVIIHPKVFLAQQNTEEVGRTKSEEGSNNPQHSNAKDQGWVPKTGKQYAEKDAVDLITSPTTIVILFIAFILWWFKRETVNLLRSLQSFRLGPVEIARAAFEEIKSEFTEGDTAIKFSISQDGKEEKVLLSDLAARPKKMEFLRFRQLYFDPDRESTAYRQLVILEARLALQEDRLRSSAHFDEDEPTWKFAEAKLKLFAWYVSLGNMYGFARIKPGSDLVDVEMADYYLKKAINLRPLGKDNQDDTIGYAHFCIAAVKGGYVLYNELGPDAEIYIESALTEISEAERAGHRPPYLYHLKGMLLAKTGPFQDPSKTAERLQEAANAWETAADLYTPPLGKCTSIVHAYLLS